MLLELEECIPRNWMLNASLILSRAPIIDFLKFQGCLKKIRRTSFWRQGEVQGQFIGT
jgi:hypothetical protein